MAQTDLFKILSALVLLLLAAHLTGRLFRRFRQPPVVGEILGGLLLGPTVLGQLLPQVQHWIFPKQGPVAVCLELVYQLGMLLLMFLAGVEMRTVFSRKDGRTVGLIAVVGMVVDGLGFTYMPEQWALALQQRGRLRVLDGSAEAAKHSALAPLTYTVQWRRDDARPLITEMREIIRSVIDFPAPRCLS